MRFFLLNPKFSVYLKSLPNRILRISEMVYFDFKTEKDKSKENAKSKISDFLFPH